MDEKHPAADARNRPLWAPWRIKYILEEKDDRCFFCDHARGEADGPDLIIARGRHCFLVLNAYPYNSGHLLVAPYRHVGDLTDLDVEEQHETMDLIVHAKKVITDVMSPQGYNFGFNLDVAGGAGVLDHLHGHLVPRWIGDTNFMPVLNDTRVVPQALEDTAEMLRSAWNRSLQEMS